MNQKLSAMLMGACLGALPLQAPALTADWSLKLKAAGLGEGERDLGFVPTPPDPAAPDAKETQEAYLDANAAVRLQFSESVATYLRVQGFAPTGRVVQTENNQPVRSQGFGALREAWIEYGSIAGYPGQVIRLGLQRVREPDGLWWDRDIEALRWVLDTTLLQAQLGVAQQLASYRTDNIELPPSQEDRPYLFGGIGAQWMPGHYVGLRGAYAEDRGELPALGSVPGADAKTSIRKLAWGAGYIDNGYYDFDHPKPFKYRGEAILLGGTRQAMQVDPVSGTVTGASEVDVRSFGADTGMRLWFGAGPQIGVAYAYGQGDADHEHQFEQTGLHSNRSRFTGTRSLIYRFNEALQADLSNLHVATAYLSAAGDANDLSLVVSSFRRDDAGGSISTSGVDVQPTVHSHDIGQGWDLVIAHYFGGDDGDQGYSWGDDARDNLRLRGSLFDPGAAYGSNLDSQYRVILEATLWF